MHLFTYSGRYDYVSLMDILRLAAMANSGRREPLDDTDESLPGELETHFLWDSDSSQFFRERMNMYMRVFSPSPQPPPERDFWIKERYMLFRKIESILISNGVTIFGGYVRDMIIHHHGAAFFFECVEPENRHRYTDPLVHPESYRDRNTYPKDIDCFVIDTMVIQTIADQLSRSIPARVGEIGKNHCYTHHPCFTTNFGCKRLTLEYTFNSSLQKKGETISLGLDMVYNLNAENKGPWNYLIDAACNMLYMNDTGLHCAFEDTHDRIENANRLVSLIELTKARVTFIPPMPHDFRCPKDECELLNIQHTRRCTEMQAIDAFRKTKNSYRGLYRVKYLQRIAKLVKEGWKITNLNIKFTVMPGNTNGETVCSISHEELVEGSLAVQLGNRTPTWTQTSVLTWQSLVQYLFSPLPRVEEVFTHRHNWSILCPISKSEIDITEIRPVGVVLKETVRFLRSRTTQ